MARFAVRKLALSHFRSHGALSIETGGASVVLYGRNGAGKTNILEAVSMLSPGSGLRRARIADMARAPARIGWKVKGEVESADGAHEVETVFSGDGARSVLVDGKPARQAALGRIVRVVWLVPAMDRLWVEGSEGRRRFLDRLAMNFDPGHARRCAAYERSLRERNRLLKERVRDPGWYQAVERQMAEAGARIETGRRSTVNRLEEAQARMETAFPMVGLSLADGDGREVLPEEDSLRSAFAEDRLVDMAAGRTRRGPHRTDLRAIHSAKGVAARQCSTGEQKALLLSLVLAGGRALAAEVGAPPILLLDEVAAHLDKSRRAELYGEIGSLSAQAWMTGTERGLFETFGGEVRTFEVVDLDGTSRVAEEAH